MYNFKKLFIDITLNNQIFPESKINRVFKKYKIGIPKTTFDYYSSINTLYCTFDDEKYLKEIGHIYSGNINYDKLQDLFNEIKNLNSKNLSEIYSQISNKGKYEMQKAEIIRKIFEKIASYKSQITEDVILTNMQHLLHDNNKIKNDNFIKKVHNIVDILFNNSLKEKEYLNIDLNTLVQEKIDKFIETRLQTRQYISPYLNNIMFQKSKIKNIKIHKDTDLSIIDKIIQELILQTEEPTLNIYLKIKPYNNIAIIGEIQEAENALEKEYPILNNHIKKNIYYFNLYI